MVHIPQWKTYTALHSLHKMNLKWPHECSMKLSVFEQNTACNKVSWENQTNLIKSSHLNLDMPRLCPGRAKYQLYCSSPGFWANRWYFRQSIETADSKVSLSWVKQCKNISQSMLSGHTARYSCAWAHLCSHLGPTLHGLRCGLQWWTDCRLAVFPPICPTSATWSPYWPLWKASVL